jgi:RNA polymerase sigma factor (sigma-70 family)
VAVALDKMLANTRSSALRTAQPPWAVGLRYRRELHNYLLRRLGRRQDVDDLTQEVYVRLLRMECMEFVREPLAYLYSVAASAVADFMRAEQRRQSVVSNDDSVENSEDDLNHPSRNDMVEEISVERQIERALNQLPRAQAAALIYHYQYGLSCDETAKQLGLSAKSVDKYLTRAKASMRVILADWRGRSDKQHEPADKPQDVTRGGVAPPPRAIRDFQIKQLFW